MLRNNIEKSLDQRGVQPKDRLDMVAPMPPPIDPNAPPPPPLSPEEAKAAQAKRAQMHKALGNVLDTMQRSEMASVRSMRPNLEEIAQGHLDAAGRSAGWQQLGGDERAAFEKTIKSYGQEGFAARSDMDALRARGFHEMSPAQQVQELRDVYKPPSTYIRNQVVDSPAFEQLPPGDKKNLDLALRQRGPDGMAMTMRAMMETEGWQNMPPDERAVHLKDLARSSVGVEDRAGVFGAQGERDLSAGDAVTDVKNQRGFAELSEDEQRRTTALVGGETNPISKAARDKYAAMKSDPVFRVMSGREQAERLRELPASTMGDQLTSMALMDGHEAGHDHTPADGHGHAREARDHELRYERPIEVTHGGRRWEADLSVVQLDGKDIEVAIPRGNTSNHPLPSAEQVAEGLARVDPKSLEAVDRVVVAPYDHPRDAAAQKQFGRDDIGSAMSVATADPSTVTVYPLASEDADKFASVMTHEAGHSHSFEKWGAEMDGHAWEQWKGAAEKDGVVPSTYGESHVAEDMAESWNLYAQTKGTPAHDELRAIFPNRFSMLDDVAAGNAPEPPGILARLGSLF